MIDFAVQQPDYHVVRLGQVAREEVWPLITEAGWDTELQRARELRDNDAAWWCNPSILLRRPEGHVLVLERSCDDGVFSVQIEAHWTTRLLGFLPVSQQAVTRIVPDEHHEDLDDLAWTQSYIEDFLFLSSEALADLVRRDPIDPSE